MSKIIIFGNSGSGKSTLARQLSESTGIVHLDLDSIAWLPDPPSTRMPLADSKRQIDAFLSANQQWVIEGCYSDLLELIVDDCDEMIFLNLPLAMCIENAKNRPWEPHKYESKKAQDANLDMLIDWIKQYEAREDSFSQKSHQALFDRFTGKKLMYSSNDRGDLQV